MLQSVAFGCIDVALCCIHVAFGCMPGKDAHSGTPGTDLTALPDLLRAYSVAK